MPRAGFYTVESGKISFRRDGNWYSDDERIDNPRIALLFSRSVREGTIAFRRFHQPQLAQVARKRRLSHAQSKVMEASP